MRKPAIIGLYSPVPGCGKDTMAAHLAHYGYANVKFARPLKDMLAVLYRALGHDDATVLHELLEGREREKLVIFPAETISMPSESMGSVEITIPAVTARDMPQTLGKEWGRDRVHRDLWITCARRAIERNQRAGIPTVVTDMRFPNEYALIRELGGECWFVDRPSAVRPAKLHGSDGQLDGDWFDLRLKNSATIEALQQGIDSYLNATQG